jgi:hypothetical protein
MRGGEWGDAVNCVIGKELKSAISLEKTEIVAEMD